MMASPEILQPVDQTTNLPAASANTEEETDEFATTANNGGGSSRPLFDLSMLSDGTTNYSSSSAAARHGGSVATTADLASDVGSTVMMPKEAFMKSFTIYRRSENDEDEEEIMNWGIVFGDPKVTKGKLLGVKNYRLPVVDIDENSIFSMSRIRQGDYLKSINGKTVGPSLNGERALEKMKSSLLRDGYLTVVTKNKEEGTHDILVHATVVKPKSGMTLEELGLKVWVWGYLCIKTIRRDTIFYRTALKETDNIVSVNEIDCQNVTPEQFAHIIQQLPQEITITVLRRKQRGTGDFK